MQVPPDVRETRRSKRPDDTSRAARTDESPRTSVGTELDVEVAARSNQPDSGYQLFLCRVCQNHYVEPPSVSHSDTCLDYLFTEAPEGRAQLRVRRAHKGHPAKLGTTHEESPVETSRKLETPIGREPLPSAEGHRCCPDGPTRGAIASESIGTVTG